LSTVIAVEELSKAYRLGVIGGGTLREDVNRWLARLRGKPDPYLKLGETHQKRQEGDRFWALRNVNFTVQQSEILGIIGRNGAGKSTLLKILSRVTGPTEGVIKLRGRIASLLEVGTGFHPELTGRENIFLNGTILGMTKAEIRSKLDEIVAFSECSQFIDTPVKRYSSGMFVRLAFAVAAHLEPEILVVDEVLAVGDVGFQKKCLGKMQDVAGAGRTVLFVSHNMQAVRALCTRCLLLKDGALMQDGAPNAIVSRYQDDARRLEIGTDTAASDERLRRGSGSVRFHHLSLEDDRGNAKFEFDLAETIRVRLRYQVLRPVANLAVAIRLNAGAANEAVTTVRYRLASRGLAAGDRGELLVEFPQCPLRPGEYALYFWLGDDLGNAFDVVDGLTAPLVISTTKSFEELGYNPAHATGFVDIPARLVSGVRN
jgi:lipopolysaccharide transport system ATP-binding protein